MGQFTLTERRHIFWPALCTCQQFLRKKYIYKLIDRPSQKRLLLLYTFWPTAKLVHAGIVALQLCNLLMVQSCNFLFVVMTRDSKEWQLASDCLQVQA